MAQTPSRSRTPRRDVLKVLTSASTVHNSGGNNGNKRQLVFSEVSKEPNEESNVNINRSISFRMEDLMRPTTTTPS